MSKKAELVGNYFGTIYLTVISFLQGIVLSQLVPNIILYFRLAENPWTDIHLLPLVLMLLIIFILWHHYAIGIFFLRWFPNIIDTIIPFVVSIAQFFLLSYLTITRSVDDIDVRSFSIGFMIILLFGCGAYFGAAHRVEADLFANIMSKENAVIHTVNSKKYYSLGGFSVLIQGLFATLIVLLRQEQLLWVSLFFFIVHITLSEYFLIHTVKPHFIKSMDEFDKSAT
jgi:hypothetical protein